MEDRKQSRKIILFPDFAVLKAEVEKLRTEVSMLLLEQDELVYVECKNIEMAYMLSLGNLEYQVYELHCAVLRLKRKTELIQAKKNRQEKVVLLVIEQILDEEFAEYQAQLDEQIHRMNAAIERSRGKFLSQEETRELKRLYRSVVKALHPDLHPDISDAQAELFRNAVLAYKSGDLNTLRIISGMVSGPEPIKEGETGMSELLREKERLISLIQEIRDDIAKIKNEYPYTMKEIVQSEEKTAEKRGQLEELIIQLKKNLEFYQSRIGEMLR